ncbi:hypothetical protein M885DRAFT_558584 [Pelagophyceae sp. CCMP2097]|nr:hypothetical protein M885DRAFT_558584 [Pelagophyceae sp. CCMP2097]
MRGQCDVAVLEAKHRAEIAALARRRADALEVSLEAQQPDSPRLRSRSQSWSDSFSFLTDVSPTEARPSKHRAAMAALEARRRADTLEMVSLEAQQPDSPRLRSRSWSDTLSFLTDVSPTEARPSDAFPDGANWLDKSAADPRLLRRWRVFVVAGLALAGGLCATGSVRMLRAARARRLRRKDEVKACDSVRDSASAWAARLASRADAFAWLALRERDLAEQSMPFLAPGKLAVAALRRDGAAPWHDGDVADLAALQLEAPDVVWSPTVQHEDRGAYEAYASARGDDRGIIDWAQGVNAGPADYVPAPPRPSYNPASLFWTSDESFTGVLQSFSGTDFQDRYRRILPAPLKKRFFDEARPVAHPPPAPAIPVGIALVVSVPLVDGNCEEDCVVGILSFLVREDALLRTFPANIHISLSTGTVVRPASMDKGRHVRTHEPFLDLDLNCHFPPRKQAMRKEPLLLLGVALPAAVAALLLILLRRVERAASRARRLGAERRKDAARDAAAAERRKDERIRDAFRSSEKTERYLNHELKNRIFVLGQSCADEAVHVQLDEMTEVLNSKAVLMRLAAGRYTPSWSAVEPAALVGLRWQRFNAANNSFDRAETTGAAAHRTVLLLDTILFNICLDSMLSNAFKYGDAARPPSLSLNVEPSRGSTRVRLSLELRNWAGPEHVALLQLGEEELNEIALAECGRTHDHAAGSPCSGDGFPMAAAAASALGGTVRLVLLPDGVLAKLELPDVEAVPPVTPRSASAVIAAPVELSRLKIAMVDDSATFRKTFERLAEKVTSKEPFVAGETRESIDGFPRAVVDSDIDVVLLDVNFAPVHHTKTGVDLCRECRELDAEAGNVPRVIFIVSANDSPEDAERYRAAGADGSLGKKMSVTKLRRVLEDAVRTHPRFAASRAVAADARADFS